VNSVCRMAIAAVAVRWSGSWAFSPLRLARDVRVARERDACALAPPPFLVLVAFFVLLTLALPRAQPHSTSRKRSVTVLIAVGVGGYFSEAVNECVGKRLPLPEWQHRPATPGPERISLTRLSHPSRRRTRTAARARRSRARFLHAAARRHVGRRTNDGRRSEGR